MARREMKHAYAQLLQAVMNVLYDFDPEGLGRSIDAPPDEYRDLATRLLGPLWRSAAPSEATAEIREHVPAARPDLIMSLWAATQNVKPSWRGREDRSP